MVSKYFKKYSNR